MAPIAMMYTLGHDFVPEGIMREVEVPWVFSILSQLVHDGLVEAVAYHQKPVFDAAISVCEI